MENLLLSIEKSLESNNWYAALILSLTLPDICGALEGKPQGRKRCSDWFKQYLDKEYGGFLSGDDCYALRCSYLHEGTDSIEHQPAREVLDKFFFLHRGSHRNKFSQSFVGDLRYDNKEILFLSVEIFSLDIVKAVRVWMKDNEANTKVRDNLKKMLEIHKNGVQMGGFFVS